jgi:glycolate oxidase iron-sulfur subunit
MLDLLPDKLPPAEPLPQLTAAVGKRVGRVALLAGCAQQVLAPDINQSAIRVLALNGIEVVVPPSQGCCGALDWHSGNGSAAGRYAAKLIASIPKDVDCLITTAAGCGSAIHEYPIILAGSADQETAVAFSKRSLDISLFLDQLQLQPIPRLRSPKRIAYHDACHLLHAQGVKVPPRSLLERIPGVELVGLRDPDICCGSAGTYNIQQPEIANKLGALKAAAIIETGASAVATGNIGCMVQIEKQLRLLGDRVAVLHTVQIIDRAYRQLLQ